MSNYNLISIYKTSKYLSTHLCLDFPLQVSINGVGFHAEYAVFYNNVCMLYYLNEFCCCFTVFKLLITKVPQCVQCYYYRVTQCLCSQGHLHLLAIKVDMLVCYLVGCMQSIFCLDIVELNNVWPPDFSSGTVCVRESVSERGCVSVHVCIYVFITYKKCICEYIWKELQKARERFWYDQSHDAHSCMGHVKLPTNTHIIGLSFTFREMLRKVHW